TSPTRAFALFFPLFVAVYNRRKTLRRRLFALFCSCTQLQLAAANHSNTGQRLDSGAPMAKLNLQTPTGRARLAPRGRPYKIRLIPGVHLGYRAAQSGTGAWVVIASKGDGTYWTDAFAHADDKQAADGQKVLTYEQAALRARALARGDANAAADRPATISEAIA